MTTRRTYLQVDMPLSYSRCTKNIRIDETVYATKPLVYARILYFYIVTNDGCKDRGTYLNHKVDELQMIKLLKAILQKIGLESKITFT